MSLNFSSIPPKRLAQGITSASSTFYINNILGFDGLTNVSSSDLGTQHYCVFRNDTGTRIEIMEIDPATISTGPITILRRGLSFYGDRTTETTALKLDWSANETIVQLGTDAPQIFQWLKEYIDAASIAGAVPASTTAKGIVELATQAEVDARTATGGTGAPLFASPDLIRASKYHDYAADAGASDAYAITITPAITAYSAGQFFTFKANTINTGACTLNVNSLGAKTIKKNVSSDLEDGDIRANQVVTVVYDGTNFQLLSRQPTHLSPITRVYTSSDTWTKPANLKYVIAEVVGGGGGGGGSTTDENFCSGGGGGGYSRKFIAAASLGATETVTVGAAGAAGAGTGGAGGTGGTSSFGSHLSATGGSGGSNGSGAGGSGGSGSSGDINTTGSAGQNTDSPTARIAGGGGSSALGGGAVAPYASGNSDVGGNQGGSYGGGGSGAFCGNGGDTPGGAGAAGVVIVTEYYN